MIVDEIDWTSAWSKKYPILASYQGREWLNTYCEKISKIYDDCKNEFDFSDVDDVLVLKDILYQKYKMEKRKISKQEEYMLNLFILLLKHEYKRVTNIKTKLILVVLFYYKLS